MMQTLASLAQGYDYFDLGCSAHKEIPVRIDIGDQSAADIVLDRLQPAHSIYRA